MKETEKESETPETPYEFSASEMAINKGLDVATDAVEKALDAFDAFPDMIFDYVAEMIGAAVNWLNEAMAKAPGLDEAADY
jgi:hypothetical protein